MFGEHVFVPYVRNLTSSVLTVLCLLLIKWVGPTKGCIACVSFCSTRGFTPLKLSWKMAQVCWWTVCLIAWLILITFLWFYQVTWTVALQIFHSTLQQIRFFIHYAKAVQRILTGVLNNSGQSLLNACTALQLCILNGMCHGDHLGRYSTHTFQTLEVLWMITSCSQMTWSLLCLQASCFRVYWILIICPLNCTYVAWKKKRVNSNEDHADTCTDTFVWNASNAQAFKDSSDSDETRTKLEYAIITIDVGINNALHAFDSSIEEMAEYMKKVLL